MTSTMTGSSPYKRGLRINWHFIPDDWHAYALRFWGQSWNGPLAAIAVHKPIYDERGRMVDREMMPTSGPIFDLSYKREC